MRFPWFLDVTNEEITLRSREQKLCYAVSFLIVFENEFDFMSASARKGQMPAD